MTDGPLPGESPVADAGAANRPSSPPPPPPPAATGPMAGASGPYAPPPCAPSAPRRRGGLAAVLLGIFLVLSLLANGGMLVAIFGLVAALGAGSGAEDTYLEKVLEAGPGSAKIAVIRVDGIIEENMAERLRGQIERAAGDANVRAVILRINSPGGGLTASDMIHHMVTSELADKKPVVAAMDGLAASGGYYIACAADEIVAQQTTITGSIGVIAQFFFVNGLLQDKLGVTTVTLKMGEQKDWPNMFAAGMTAEQSEYLMDVLLKPGYEQFVGVVAKSRDMDVAKVKRLATGRVFMAAEAKAAGLIDEIGYFERAVEIARKRAGLTEARVVEYVQPFNFGDLLGLQARSGLLGDLKPEKLHALATPKVMCLWTAN